MSHRADGSHFTVKKQHCTNYMHYDFPGPKLGKCAISEKSVLSFLSVFRALHIFLMATVSFINLTATTSVVLGNYSASFVTLQNYFFY